MGKIFGISDLPVGSLEQTISVQGNSIVPEPIVTEINSSNIYYAKPNFKVLPDVYVTRTGIVKSNPVIKKRYGIGKLLKGGRIKF